MKIGCRKVTDIKPVTTCLQKSLDSDGCASFCKKWNFRYMTVAPWCQCANSYNSNDYYSYIMNNTVECANDEATLYEIICKQSNHLKIKFVFF